jgi:poly-gamma-glutamate synthesis protein (capsule biosynthesis protein)
MNVVGASLANNHAWDFGELGAAETERLLRTAEITPLAHGVVADLGGVRILPLTFKRGYFADHEAIRTQEQLMRICAMDAVPPLIVFAHWGGEYVDRPGPFEVESAGTMATCGVSGLVGAHSHAASDIVERAGGGAFQYVFSLGNLVFDQRRDDVSGALAELRIFGQSTIALRLVPLPNLFEAARERLGTEQASHPGKDPPSTRSVGSGS